MAPFAEHTRVRRLLDVVGGVAHHHARGALRRLEDRAELAHVARAEEVVDLGHLERELFGVALREAAGDDEA